MPNENQSDSTTNNPAESENETPETKAPRAKTPLELVREGQAKMRGQKSSGGRSSKGGGPASGADGHSRPQFNRKAG